jgi:thymidylate kinase
MPFDAADVGRVEVGNHRYLHHVHHKAHRRRSSRKRCDEGSLTHYTTMDHTATVPSPQHGSSRQGRLIAVWGPDGAGKSTLINRLQEILQPPVVIVYMGGNRAKVTHATIATRWASRQIRGDAGRLSFAGKALKLVRPFTAYWHQLAEYVYCYSVARSAAKRGITVLCDRYPYDLWVDAQVERAPLARRLRAGLVLLFPPPDLLLLLDAPGAVAYARKKEHSAEKLDAIRAVHARLAWRFPAVVRIDATEPIDRVVEHAVDAIEQGRGAGPGES